MDKTEYLDWFKDKDFEGVKIEFGKHESTLNVQIMVNTHVRILRRNWGKITFRPYAKRLEFIKKQYLKKYENGKRK